MPAERPGTVYLVGAGPGDPGLITVKGAESIRRADVVIYDRLAHPDLAAGEPEPLDRRRERVRVQSHPQSPLRRAVHGLAPGFPPTWGEPMHLFGGSTYTLQPGMVVTVEPPVFLGEERLGTRLIDNLLVTTDGAELLSRFSRDLIVIE